MDKVILDEIERLHNTLQALLPLTGEQESRLNDKFSLEFNYNSNHIEGNTLTYTETKQFLQFNETQGNHTLREYEEMRASEVALKLVKELATDAERPLTETVIKKLNKVLLVRPYWKNAITPDKQDTRKKILVGGYKQQPNSVLLENGKMFHYTSPAETPMKMHDLLDWYKEATVTNNMHPVAVAALLHYRFACIHPFDDGNGRISRLLMNYVLYKNNLPSIIIKSDDKHNYRRALHDADAGNTESFINYISQQLIYSLELTIKAASNETLEEQGNWKKKLQVLKTSMHKIETLEQVKSVETVLNVINKEINPVLIEINEELNNFDDFFILKETYLVPKGLLLFKNDITFNEVEQYNYDAYSCFFSFKDFRKNSVQPFKVDFLLEFKFETFDYKIFLNDKLLIIKSYHQEIIAAEKELLLSECANVLLFEIQKHVNN